MASFSGEVLSEHDVAVHAAMRSPLHVVGMVLFGGLFGTLPFYPPAGELLGVSAWVTSSWALAYVTLFALACLSFHRDGGRSLRYRLLHRFETAFAGLGAACVIAAATRPDTLLWVLLFSFAYQSGTVGTNRPYTAAVIALAGLVASASRVLRGDYGAALIGGALTVSSTSIYLMLSAAARHLSTVIAERETLQQRVADLEVQAERVRIARDLHDGLGTELSALVWSARMLEERVSDPVAAREVAQFSDRIRFGMQELRSIVWGLRGTDRTLADLAQHLESRCREIAGNIDITFSAELTHEDQVIAPDLGVHFVRIVQEAVRNAARHAAARRIAVSFVANGVLAATITDDGHGFEQERVAHDEGGLSNMRHRAERCSGRVSVESGARGTTVRVKLPLTGEPALQSS